MPNPSQARVPAGRGHRWLRLVLLGLPTAALLALPLYNKVEPRVFGLTMFYWYQIAWIILAVALSAGVLVLDRRVDHQARRGRPPNPTGED
jgi:hypothetical protein